jgi:hypothetical protein
MPLSDYQLIQDELQPYFTGSRTKSAALLAWFLEAVWRIEPEDIDDAICDGSGDKGIDGLLVDDDLAEITVLQAKHKEKEDGRQGDLDLRTLVGTAAYFENDASVDGLLAADPNVQLRRLLTRMDVKKKVADGAHANRLIFVTDGTLDDQGRGFVDATKGNQPPLDVWDQPRLAAVARRTRRPDLLDQTVVLEATSPPTVIIRDGNAELAVGIVPAKQLLALPGLDDLSLFARNVRLSEGPTRINRELGQTVDDPNEHDLFTAYHNGLTMLTYGLTITGNEIELNGLTVVNGCQSLLTLFEHQAKVTDKLQLLVKIVRVERQTDLADKITYRSNNQNPVDIRDQRSTDIVQRDLQAQMQQSYGSMLFYAIREGERPTAPEVLDNKTAAQFLMAVYLCEPWNAVRKVRLFDTDYRRIFDHTVTAHKLFLLKLFVKVIDEQRNDLDAELRASFASIRFTLAFLLSQFLRKSDLGSQLLEYPERWLPGQVTEVEGALLPLAQEIVKSVNHYVISEARDRADNGEDFDPKVAFKSKTAVGDLEHQVVRLSERLAMGVDSYWFEVEPKS